MNLGVLSRCIWFIVVAFALVCSAHAFNPVEWAKGVVHNAHIELPELHLDEILRQVSNALPSVNLKEVEKGLLDFAHKVVQAEQTLEKALAEGNFDVGHFSEAFVREIEKRGDEFQQELLTTVRLSEEDDVHFADLERSLDHIFERVAGVFVDVAVALQVDRGHATGIFNDIRGPIKHAVVVIAKAIERHPCLFELAIYLALQPLPFGDWLVRPIISLLGFSARGPMKGTIASSMQRKVYKGSIPKNSWFSKVQSTGMKGGGIPALGAFLEASVLGSILVECIT